MYRKSVRINESILYVNLIQILLFSSWSFKRLFLCGLTLNSLHFCVFLFVFLCIFVCIFVLLVP